MAPADHKVSKALLTVLLVSSAACALTQPARRAPNALIGTGQGIDHVTVLTRDVAAAAKRFADDFGFTVGPVRTFSFGFQGATIYFSDLTYVELYAVHDRDVVGRSGEAFALDAPEGVRWVTLDVDSVGRAEGFLKRIGKPIAGRYRVPDDEKTWGFQLIEPAQPFLPGGRIYFIEYNDETRERFRAENRALVEGREVHANTAQGLRSVWVTVPDLTAAASSYASAGMPAGPEFNLAALSSRAREIQMPGGTILLVEQPSSVSPQQNAAFAGLSIKVGSLDTVRTLLRKKTGLEHQPYAGRYGRSVLIPASLAYGTVIEFFE